MGSSTIRKTSRSRAEERFEFLTRPGAVRIQELNQFVQNTADFHGVLRFQLPPIKIERPEVRRSTKIISGVLISAHVCVAHPRTLRRGEGISDDFLQRGPDSYLTAVPDEGLTDS